MTESATPDEPERRLRGWRWLALAWLLVLAGVAWHQWGFWQSPRIDSDILALLPQEAGDPAVDDATRRIAGNSSRDVVVMLGAEDADAVLRARDAFEGAIQASAQQGVDLLVAERSPEDWFSQAREVLAPHRDRLLTPAQRQHLEQTPADALAESALAALYGPMGAPRLTEWRSDPLGLWPQWWQAQATASGMALDGDGLLQAEDRHWAVLQFTLRESAFKLDGERRLQDLLDAASAAAKAVAPGVQVLKAGVPLHAESAAVQANREVNTIGWGSLAAVLLLVWLAFRSLRPLLLVALSLLVGCAVALTVTVLVFGKVHLLTLIFGASLVGVAEDYGIHWFASRQGEPKARRWSLLRHLLPGLWLALLTSAMAYLALGLAPFPGLRQMALFSVVGLAAAFLTVIFGFPWLDGGEVRTTAFSRWLGGTLASWPRLANRRGGLVLAAVVLLVAVPGLMQVRGNDDLRSLQSSPPELIAQQRDVGRLLGMPSPAQFYLVQGRDAEEVLQREEHLVARLRDVEAKGLVGGHRALSDWLPSQRQQENDAALTARAEREVLARLSVATGETLARGEFVPRSLTLDTFLASPAALPVRHLWLGEVGQGVASVVMVNDLPRPDALATFAAQADGIEGVRWIDRTADISRLLQHYRRMMTGLLLAGVVVVFGVLAVRYRGQAWRVITPTLLAGVLTVALLGWLGQPLQLFNVLALMLLLGMGIDYGIFLVEHRGDASAWLAVCVGAASTWLSFGLLGLSATPALRAFGLTLLFGIGLVWLLSPLFRPPPDHSPTNGNTVA
ncbi:MMPL family transporter [Pseudoxanthomonas sp. PXM02]|uniref:MMPL family transporter n=1 Tax=Pseudoxanthomonas sp. PXM02 TaxID=2769294 RepID=UPI00178009DD|nr:MMPL family transporter [Pseudoxanthomonas sp. PXM02]MBD9481224.1 MMPL family transporter [Pseudoxanthomonas sp. PXM02]